MREDFQKNLSPDMKTFGFGFSSITPFTHNQLGNIQREIGHPFGEVTQLHRKRNLHKHTKNERQNNLEKIPSKQSFHRFGFTRKWQDIKPLTSNPFDPHLMKIHHFTSPFKLNCRSQKHHGLGIRSSRDENISKMFNFHRRFSNRLTPKDFFSSVIPDDIEDFSKIWNDFETHKKQWKKEPDWNDETSCIKCPPKTEVTAPWGKDCVELVPPKPSSSCSNRYSF